MGLSYEIMDDAAQAFLKVKIMDNIHKYYYLILFTAYIREAANEARNKVSDEQKAALTLPSSGKCAIPGDQLKLGKSFVDFMNANTEVRGLIDTGKGDLQWERDIPAAALANLESLAKGDFKKRAKYRFASKTLMRILPASVKAEVEGLIEKKAITLDLYEILGKCTWKPIK